MSTLNAVVQLSITRRNKGLFNSKPTRVGIHLKQSYLITSTSWPDNKHLRWNPSLDLLKPKDWWHGSQ